MYGNGRSYYDPQPFQDEEDANNYRYGQNYRSLQSGQNESSIKGKLEQKYWKSKQKVIEKLGKGQDEFVIAGDAEVDSRLEAFQHIKLTCIQLMTAIEFYQTRIFALSQDENEMGRFLRDQGATDKTKAGKMMISVGKAQSFAAQQRLSLRTPLVRLYAELETFRFRAIQDTQMTVEKMEQARSDYRARLLWMADISKELDPDQNKRLGKFRDVQIQVKSAKALFDKLKVDVVQKIDLLSASRCNLLSATLEPYQTAMIKFLSTTAKSYTAVYAQYQGHPSYQFQILKHIIPNNGIAEDEEEEEERNEEGKLSQNQKSKNRKVKKNEKEKIEKAKDEILDNKDHDVELVDNDNDDKLINFDCSPVTEDVPIQKSEFKSEPSKQSDDLLVSLQDTSPVFGEFTNIQDQQPEGNDNGFEDLLGQFEENNIPPSMSVGNPDLLKKDQCETKTNYLTTPSVDDLLFGSPVRQLKNDNQQSDIDILSEVLSNQSLGISDSEYNSSFSSQWQSLFGAKDSKTSMNEVAPAMGGNIDPGMKSKMFMPSFLLSQMRQVDPIAMSQGGAPKDINSVKDNSKAERAQPIKLAKAKENDKKGKDMSAWFNLFADLDPLANPDEVDGTVKGKQAC
ncbi:islet cell autoantigen 1 isoform X1 [Hydra vulgaris]|uniref:islet cell autoantigen 1 isoform X1 n=1 Tax=Hydra vulgaris TaxID=6087 RepID=UPI0001926E97|nr:islet cell autoantigen 1 [Hydra vulgaris]